MSDQLPRGWKAISNILWVDDPDSDWSGYYRARRFPDECECCIDFVNEAYDKDFECSCPEEKYIPKPPRQMAIWEVIIFDPGARDKGSPHGIIAKAEGLSQEQAYLDAVAAAVRKLFDTITDPS